MKLKKYMKRISAVLLAATMIVVSLPNQPIVKADEDDFPEEILFPISILDFPADNLFFECAMNWMEDYTSRLDMYKYNVPGVNTDANKGQGLVADRLEDDPASLYYRLPVYNEKTVDYIAKRVQTTMKEATSSALAFNKPYVNHTINPICATNYIRRDGWKTLDASDTFYETDYNANKFGIYYYSTLGGNAVSYGNNNCLKGNYVGYIGGTPDIDAADQGTVTFKYNNTLGAGTYTMRIYYMSADNRRFSIKVNDAAAFNTAYLNNATWSDPKDKPYNVNVYLKAGVNTITFGGDGTDYAPDLDRIEIGTVETVDDTIVEAETGNVWATWDPNIIYPSYVHIGGWNSNYSFSANIPKTGTYNIDVYYRKSEDENWFSLRVNNTFNTSNPHFVNNADMTKNPVTITGVNLNAGVNNFQINNWSRLDIDKFVFTYAPEMTGDFELGSYAESKEKYNIDRDGNKISDYGFYDMTTCYDYAYFITSNLYKYHPSINSAYGNYNNLVFHRVEQNGKYYYEFMADALHNEKVPWVPYSKHYGGEDADRDGYKKSIELMYEDLKDEGSADEKEAELNKYAQVQKGIGRLIYNPETRSIRNACDASGNYVGPKAGEYETASGSMFVCDGDEYNTDMSNHYAGEGIKKYPTLDPPKVSEDLWGYDDLKHNFNYTIRTHSRFVYKEGADQKFFFSGDDDVYVFINGNLLVDLGGQHSQLNGSFNLDTLAEDPKYGLINGKAVDFDFFYMERHSKESNFWAKMSFKLKNDEVELQWPDEFDTLSDLSIPYGWVVDLNYKFSSMRELTTNKNVTFSDELGDIIGAKDFKLCDEVKLRPDKKLTVTVKRAQPDGTYVDEVKEFTFADQHDFTALEVEAVKQFFTDLSLEQDDSVELDGLQYDTSKKPFTYFDETEDAKIRQLHFETKAEYDAYMTMGGTNSIEDTVAIHSEIKDSVTVKVLIGALKVSTKIEGLGENFDIKKDLSAFGHFTISREETEDDSSTPDVDESIVYENQFEIAKGDNVIMFDAGTPDDPDPNTIYRDPLPKGTYKLKMDVDMLTGYTVAAEVRVNGETIAEISKGDLKLVKQTDTEREFTFDSIYIEINPKIENGKWVYPEVEYILKAYREVNPLKDLT